MSLHTELVSLNDIAEMYKVTRRYARDFLVKKPGFPLPANGSTKKNPVWLEASLREYMSGKCRTNPAHGSH